MIRGKNDLMIRIVAVALPLSATLLAIWLLWRGARKKETPAPAVKETAAAVQQTEPRDLLPLPPAPRPQELPPQEKSPETEKSEPQPAPPQPEKLSDAPEWLAFLKGDYIMGLVQCLDEISMGYVPAKSMGHLRNETPFTAVQTEGGWVVSQQSAERYTRLVDVFCAMDPKMASALLQSLKPAIKQALEACGYVDKTPEELFAAANQLIQQLPDDLENQTLIRLDEHLYRWKDPQLEGMMPVQKFIMRLGPQNCRRIKAQVQAILGGE